MADIRITELPVATTINSSVDVLPLVTATGTVTSKATPNQSFGVAINLLPSINATIGGSSFVFSNTPMIMQSNGTVVAVSGTDANNTNLTDQNFVGFTANNQYAGATQYIYTYGHLITGLSGLTPGLRYYVTETGALSTIPGTPEVIAGTAVSTTSLLMNS